MQIELPVPAWTALPGAHDDAHTWTLPAPVPLELAPISVRDTAAEVVRTGVTFSPAPTITLTL